MEYSVLLVDGPRRGESVAIDDPNRPDWFVPLPPPLDVFSFAEDPDPFPRVETAHYKITRIKMFGQHLLVGSVNERPSDYDLFIALASDKAKWVVIS